MDFLTRQFAITENKHQNLASKSIWKLSREVECKNNFTGLSVQVLSLNKVINLHSCNELDYRVFYLTLRTTVLLLYACLSTDNQKCYI